VIQRRGNRGQELAVEDMLSGTSMATNVPAPLGHKVSLVRGRKNVVALKNERTTHECH
jgi:hypothetical protein